MHNLPWFIAPGVWIINLTFHLKKKSKINYFTFLFWNEEIMWHTLSLWKVVPILNLRGREEKKPVRKGCQQLASISKMCIKSSLDGHSTFYFHNIQGLIFFLEQLKIHGCCCSSCMLLCRVGYHPFYWKATGAVWGWTEAEWRGSCYYLTAGEGIACSNLSMWGNSLHGPRTSSTPLLCAESLLEPPTPKASDGIVQGALASESISYTGASLSLFLHACGCGLNLF